MKPVRSTSVLWTSVLGISGLLSLLSCAEDLPGVIPPANQLYYPLGLAVLEGSPSVLAVANTNFDQRYNAGTLTTLKLDELIAALPAADAPVSYIEDVTPFVAGSVRINNFASDLVAVPQGAAGRYRVVFAHRGRNRIQVVEANNGALDCSTDARPPELGLDCTLAYLGRTQYGDPFAIAYSPTSSVVAVGHLLTQQEVRQGPLISGLTVAEMSGFDRRIAAEVAGTDPDDTYEPRLARFNNISGTNALAFVPGSKIGSPLGSFLAAGRRVGVDSTTEPSLLSFDLAFDENGARLLSPSQLSVSLEAIAFLDEARGIVVSPSSDRVFLSVRMRALDGTISSGMGVFELDNSYLRARSIAEGGEELGDPVVLERTIDGRLARWLYVPDILTDSIWVFDASTDQITVIGEIGGREMRTVGGATFAAHLLDAPSKIVFVERNGRTFGFVSNFANSTLAVIDATSASPLDHRVIARIGGALDPDGNQEGSE